MALFGKRPVIRRTGKAPLFVSKIDAVKAKIAEVEAEIVEATGALALQAALADEATGLAAVARLNHLRDRLEYFQHALAAAEQAERDKLAELSSREDKARDRALRQHLASIERAAVSHAAAQSAYRDTFRQLVEAADSARKTLPRHLRNNPAAGIEELLSVTDLRRLVDCVAYKLSDGGIAAPGADRKPEALGMIERPRDGYVPGLVELIATKVIEPVRRHIDGAPANPLPPAGDAGAPVPAEPHPLAGGGAAPVALPASAPMAKDAPITGTLIDMRGGRQEISDLTVKMPPPVPYSEPTEPELEEGGGSANPELSPSTQPRYTEASERF